MRHVAIVILNFNGRDDTIECLASIRQLSTNNSQLTTIVVDNGSTERFRIDDLRLKNGQIEILRNEENLGFSGGNNVGIRYALENGANYITLLNNDTLVDKSLTEELLKVFESDRQIGIVAPKIYFAPGFEFHKNRYKKEEQGKVLWYGGGLIDWKSILASHRGVDEVDNGQYGEVRETDFASGCCMMVKREVFEKVGLLDEKYFLYYEDSDFSIRAKKAGFKIIFAPQATLWHKNAASAHGSGSSLQDYYITRSRLLFGMRYAPFRSKVALVRESLVILGKGRAWQKRGVFDFFRRKFGKGSFPI